MTEKQPATPQKTDHIDDLGTRVRAARAKVGMTRKQLAAVSDTSERYLAQIEGNESNPSVHVLLALSTALDVAPAELMPMGGERSLRHATVFDQIRRLPGDSFADLERWLNNGKSAQTDKADRIVLVGLRGAGKSSLGLALAENLGLPFIEMTKVVEENYGGEMGLLIDLGGQPALRRYEEQAWEDILSSHDKAIIATPGGVVANAPLYERILSTSHTIWLTATPDDHMGRVMAQGDFRPMASNRRAMADLKAILEARTADYARADARIDTSKQDFDATLELLKQKTLSLHAL